MCEKNNEEVASQVEDTFSKNKHTLFKVACTLELVKIWIDRSPDDSCSLEP